MLLSLKLQKLNTTWRETFYIKINKKISFKPGDSIGFINTTHKKIVKDLLTILNLKDMYIRITKDFEIEKIELSDKNPKNRFINENKIIYEGYLSFYLENLDLFSIPKKRFLKSCGLELNNTEYLNLINYSLVEIIEKYNIKPDLKSILQFYDLNKPRYYSFISENEFIALINYRNKIDYKSFIYNIGHFSTYLFYQNEYPEYISYVYRENKCLKFKDENMMLIATGTGITPFISFIENSTKKVILIYGYRNSNDNILQEYFKINPEKRKILNKNIEIIEMLSSKNEYVTKYLEENFEKYQDFLKTGNVYVCGGKMKKEIYSIFLKKYSQIFKDKRIFFDNWT